MQAVNRLSAAQRQAVAQQDAPFLVSGLVLGNARSFEAHLRQAALLMRDRQTSASPCARLVRHVYDLFERSVPQWARDSLACASGCGFCCYQTVGASPPEVFFLARLIAEEPDSVAAVRDTAAKLDNRSAGTPAAFWLKCPLLDQASNCSAYAARPMACRSYVSIDVKACKAVYLQPGDGIVHAPAPYEDLKNSCRMILQACLRLNGLPAVQYELNAALRIVLDTENAERRWLRGEALFAGLPELAPNSPQAEQVLALIEDRIGPTL